MSLFNHIYNTIINTLFPFSWEEKELFSYSPLQAYEKLDKISLHSRELNSIFKYKDKRVSRLIWNIKYKKSPEAIHIGAYALYQELCKKYKDNVDKIYIIPIPTTFRRRNERGFNQCELLVDAIKNFDTNSRFEVIKDLLLRSRHKSRQTLKDRAHRLENAQGIFSINGENDKNFLNLIGKNSPIIIIDDVITTGSTIHAAIKTLKEYGFSNVSGLSLAH